MTDTLKAEVERKFDKVWYRPPFGVGVLTALKAVAVEMIEERCPLPHRTIEDAYMQERAEAAERTLGIADAALENEREARKAIEKEHDEKAVIIAACGKEKDVLRGQYEAEQLRHQETEMRWRRVCDEARKALAEHQGFAGPTPTIERITDGHSWFTEDAALRGANHRVYSQGEACYICTLLKALAEHRKKWGHVADCDCDTDAEYKALVVKDYKRGRDPRCAPAPEEKP